MKFAHLSTAQGLSQSTVLCILQDRQGALWLGTAAGLNRLAGGRLTRFLHDSTKPDGPASPNIKVAILDRRGALWLATGLGLVRYDAAAASRAQPQPQGRFSRL